MNAMQKKIVSAILICLLLVIGAAAVKKSSLKVPASEDTSEQVLAEAGRPEETDSSPDFTNAATDLTFWYEDPTYTAFLEKAARQYFAETKIKVSLECRESIDYMGEIYDKTMQDDAFPDVYLISGDNLEEAYLYGLVSVNEYEADYEAAAQNAVTASSYRDKMLGYPLSFNTGLFIYQTDYFEKAPESLQAIIDYSNENEPAENVEYLLEWDVNDAFYDFPFISNSVSFEKTESETMEVVYDEALYQKDLEFFDNILISFSVDAKTVSEESILENFRTGKTLCAIIDSDSLYRLKDYNYSLMQIPDLNEELKSSSCAITDMLVVNAFSNRQQKAADFARYATVQMADELHAKSGHYPVFLPDDADAAQQIAYQSYESAVLVPNSQDAKDFWVNLEETISKYF